MQSDYNGYTIIHDRNNARAWKGEVSNRAPDVSCTDLAAAMQVIDILVADEKRHATNDVVVEI